ncbi:MAG: alpha/beta fold hydrolase [Candidatus Competibacterales bacterium]
MATVALDNGLSLAVEAHGPASGVAVVLILGIGAPLSLWPPTLYRRLAAAGYRVILFDNRDVGLSFKVEIPPRAGFGATLWGALRDRPVPPVYTLDHMAEDVRGLLDRLDIERAHVVGVSMGGMIAQRLACSHPQRLLSLTSIMSCSCAPRQLRPHLRLLGQLTGGRPGGGPEVRQTFLVRWLQRLDGPHYRYDVEELRATVAASYTRGGHGETPGLLRQLQAILAAPGWEGELASLPVPTLVIHGHDDPLVPVAAGIATARAIPQARRALIDGLGHSLSPAAIGAMLPPLLDHLARIDAQVLAS